MMSHGVVVSVMALSVIVIPVSMMTYQWGDDPVMTGGWLCGVRGRVLRLFGRLAAFRQVMAGPATRLISDD